MNSGEHLRLIKRKTITSIPHSGNKCIYGGIVKCHQLALKMRFLKRVNYSLCEEGLFTCLELSETTHCVDSCREGGNMEIYRLFLEELERGGGRQRSIFSFHP